MALEYGAHLPLIDLGAPAPSLREYARVVEQFGFRYVCANDHLLFQRPWLDGLTALSALVEESSTLTLATSVALPVVRGPVQLAKAAAAIDILSGGRLILGGGPGSSAADYAAAAIPFEERWPRFDETLRVLRNLLGQSEDEFEGRFYSTRGVKLEPAPHQRPTPPIWVASWGSPAGLRRVARYGDGWLASAYNTTPDRFRECLVHIGSGHALANALATTWLCITDSRAKAEQVYREVLAPLLRRPVEELEALSLPIGPADVCAERLRAFAEAGVQRVFLWPLRDELAQLERFREQVVPLVDG